MKIIELSGWVVVIPVVIVLLYAIWLNNRMMEMLPDFPIEIEDEPSSSSTEADK